MVYLGVEVGFGSNCTGIIAIDEHIPETSS